MRLESFTWRSRSFCRHCEAVRGLAAEGPCVRGAAGLGRGLARQDRARPPRWECRRRQQQGRFGPFPLPGIPDLISAVTPAGLAVLPNPQLGPGAGSLRAPSLLCRGAAGDGALGPRLPGGFLGSKWPCRSRGRHKEIRQVSRCSGWVTEEGGAGGVP